MYDDLNRLRQAVYGEKTATNTYTGRNRYDSEYTYDANGNITSLERKSLVHGVGMRIDQLAYCYFTDGRLMEIEEESDRSLGFKSIATNGVAQYQYDLNGNMTSDGHKGITVDYNYLNLPIQVLKPNEGSIDWAYDAVGNKLSKTVIKDSLLIIDNVIPDGEYNANLITSTGNVVANSDVIFTASDSIVLKVGFSAKNDFIAKIGANEGVTRHYVGGIEYFDGEMEAIYHEAGRVVFETGTQEYEYRIADHLGNTRSVFKDDGSGVAERIQKNDYYAFGLAFEDDFKAYAYTFGNKEVQSELGLDWLDFGARCYARDMARWVQVDPLNEATSHATPYHYVLNNPIRNSDPTGMLTENEFGVINVSSSPWGRDVTGAENTGDVLDRNKSTGTVIYDSNGNELYKSKDNLRGAVVIVSEESIVLDIFSKILEALEGATPDRKSYLLRMLGDKYYTDDLNNLWDKGQASRHPAGYNGVKSDKGDGSYIPEVSVVMYKNDKGEILPDWERFRDHKDPMGNMHMYFEGTSFVHTHPEGAAYWYSRQGGSIWVKKRATYPAGGPPSFDDFRQISGKDMKGLFNVAVSKNTLYFFNNKDVEFSVSRNFFNQK